MKAFQFDHPQLHKYYVEVAEKLKNDIAIASQHSGNVVAPKTDAIKMLKGAGLTYAEMYDACEKIINDQGQENFAAAKKVEIVLDIMLSDGYKDSSGNNYEANGEYISEKSKIAGGETEAERRVRHEKQADESIDAFDGHTPTAEERARREKKYQQTRSLFPENSLGAKITKGMPEGTGAASNPFVPQQKTSKVFTNTFQKTESLTEEQRAQMKPEDYTYNVENRTGDVDARSNAAKKENDPRQGAKKEF